MTPPLSTRLLAAALLTALAVPLASCGRKGPLEPDPSSQIAQPHPSDDDSDEARESKPRPGAPPRPFLLDPML